MKLIGYWMESLSDLRLPLPQELVSDAAESARDKVCAYLERGELFETSRGFSWCRFHCGAAHREMGHREFTDGEWVWPEGLSHYVMMHGVLLPEEFLACVTSERSVCVDGIREASLEYWLSWAQTRRSSTIRERLSNLLVESRAQEPAVIEALVREVLRSETESSTSCAFAGCSKNALAGRRVCARHYLTDDQLRWGTEHLYRLPRNP